MFGIWFQQLNNLWEISGLRGERERERERIPHIKDYCTFSVLLVHMGIQIYWNISK